MLTKLQLTEIADDDETPIMRLLDALLSFDCRGSYLFTAHARSQLLGTQLTELVFSPRAIDGRNNLSVPFLPVSLLRLHLKGETRHMNRHDWSCLEACTNLEVLTLSCHAVVSLDIWEWIRSMQHLRVIDFEWKLRFVMKLWTKVYCMPDWRYRRYSQVMIWPMTVWPSVLLNQAPFIISSSKVLFNVKAHRVYMFTLAERLLTVTVNRSFDTEYTESFSKVVWCLWLPRFIRSYSLSRKPHDTHVHSVQLPECY